MKRLVITLLTISIGTTLFAQPAGFERLYYTYRGEEGVTSVRVPGFLMKLAGAVADLDREERRLLRSLRSVRVLTIEDRERYPGLNFAREMDASRMRGDYRLLMEIHQADEDVIIAARERNGKITDLVVVVGGNDNVLVHVRGRMNSDLLGSLAEVAGLEALKITSTI